MDSTNISKIMGADGQDQPARLTRDLCQEDLQLKTTAIAQAGLLNKNRKDEEIN